MVRRGATLGRCSYPGVRGVLFAAVAGSNSNLVVSNSLRVRGGRTRRTPPAFSWRRRNRGGRRLCGGEGGRRLRCGTVVP